MTMTIPPVHPAATAVRALRGYTLIEMMVAISVFIIVVSIAVGAYVNSLRSQRAALFLMAVNDNVSLTIEQMTREMRVGADITVVSPGPADPPRIQFVDQSGRLVGYRREGSAIERFACASVPCPQPLEWLPMTSELVRVTSLEFDIRPGTLPGGRIPMPDLTPTRVTIVMTVEADHPMLRANPITLQTTITARE